MKHFWKYLCVIFLLFAGVSLYAQSAAVSGALNFRLSLYGMAGNKIMPAIDEYLEKHVESAPSNGQTLTEDDKLTITNILLPEKQNVTDSEDTEQQEKNFIEAKEELDKCKSFLEAKGAKKVSVYFLVSYADLEIRQLSFLPSTQQVSEAMYTKYLYEQAQKKDRNSSYALRSYGLWLYFAPPIAGGGYDAALKTLTQALKKSKTPEEKYFALLYRSQVYFALRDKNSDYADLDAAHEAYQDENFTEFVKKLNEENKSFL